MATIRATYNNTIIDLEGSAISGAFIELRIPDTTTKIAETIYDDATGSGTLDNPFQTDSSGRFSFYLANPQRVDIYVSAAGHTPYTLADVDVGRAAEGRSVTSVVAADDASAAFKRGADHVCDGTADEVEINAAIATL